jgi:uncharacterized protein (DUF362 family)
MSPTATRESGRDRSFTRREVLRLAAGISGVCALGAGAGACARVARCRDVSPNPFVDAGRPLLVVVRGEDLGAMLRAGLERIGGLGRLLTAGREALLKGNFCARQPYPVTTAADTIVAVAQELKRAGFARTTLFESQGTRLVPGMSPDEAVRKLGVFDQVARHGVEVRMCDPLEMGEFRPVQNRAWSIQRPVTVHRALHDAAVVLSLPIPKRHQEARFSCALKMHFGSVAQADRYLAHKNGRTGRRSHFDDRLVHFADAVRPQLNIVDARALLARGGRL